MLSFDCLVRYLPTIEATINKYKWPMLVSESADGDL